MNNVSYQVARNCMELIKNGAVNDAFEALGISSDDFILVCGDIPWIGADRGRVTGVLNQLTHGTLDVIGLPRIEVPCEYRAGVIATFVHPGNMAVACRWLETGPSASDLSEGGSVVPVSANTLFALCARLYGDAPAAIAAWRKATGRAVREVEGSPDPLPLEVAADG